MRTVPYHQVPPVLGYNYYILISIHDIHYLVSYEPFKTELGTEPVNLLLLQVLVEYVALPHLLKVEEHNPCVDSLQRPR